MQLKLFVVPIKNLGGAEAEMNAFPRDQKFVLGDRIETQLPEPGGGSPHHKGTQ